MAVGSGFVVGLGVAGLTAWSGLGGPALGYAAGLGTAGIVGSALGTGTDYLVGNPGYLGGSTGVRFLEGTSGGILGTLEAPTLLALEANAGNTVAAGTATLMLKF